MIDQHQIPNHIKYIFPTVRGFNENLRNELPVETLMAEIYFEKNKVIRERAIQVVKKKEWDFHTQEKSWFK